ncbi:hypothetical protein V5F49_20535 [Xanthobacter sp. V3C-3]|uniref:phage tail assembly chaperone n=1 Tax=Xanthobacter lutulentifluminis TaxID=3119935 RepID=UPI0037269474
MEFEEFDLDGVKYRARKMAAMDQLFVARKLTPIVGTFVPLIQAAARQVQSGGTVATAIMSLDVAQLAPLAQGIASLPEEDTNALIARCLAHVQRGSVSPAGTSWANVWSVDAGRPMFDMDLMTMLTLVVHVVKKDLGNFTGALLSGSTVGAGLFQT